MKGGCVEALLNNWQRKRTEGVRDRLRESDTERVIERERREIDREIWGRKVEREAEQPVNPGEAISSKVGATSGEISGKSLYVWTMNFKVISCVLFW
jgi:hypothetical protein